MVAGSRARISGSSSLMTYHISCGRARRPVRPIRCRKLETVQGASIWKARSRRPMSIPSSRVDVVTVVKGLLSSFISISAVSR